jgi:hypothetical protein
MMSPYCSANFLRSLTTTCVVSREIVVLIIHIYKNNSDLQVMTPSICNKNVKDCSKIPAVNGMKNYGPSDCCYRLWGPVNHTTGKPNTILVYGAPALRLEKKCALPNPGHILKRPNNPFCNLGTLLQNDLYGKHTIWEFEYADEPFDLLNEHAFLNFGCLKRMAKG